MIASVKCHQFVISRCNIPDNIMNQASLLQMLREVLPVPGFDFFRKPSPLLLPVFHTLNILLCNPSLLLEACPRLRSGQYRPSAVTAQRNCCCCGKTARSARDPTGGKKAAVWRLAERCRLWPHWTGLRMRILIKWVAMDLNLDTINTSRASSRCPRFFR